MTERLADSLDLQRENCSVPINAVNDTTTCSRGLVTATIKSPLNEYNRTLTFLVVAQISRTIPGEPIDRSRTKIPPNVHLADPHFHIPAHVDLLLGAGTTLSLLCVGQLKLPTPAGLDLYLQKTLLGWVIGGSVPSTRQVNKRSCHVTNLQLHSYLTKFWEIEEGTPFKVFTAEENECEDHYKAHTTRNDEGRYIVALPFKANLQDLGESKDTALRRLRGIERKLDRDPELKVQYHTVIQEYLALGHMSPINDASQNDEGYYLPHHAVIKHSSATTKVRIVFDGSSKTTTGVALNETLLVGPTIQPDIFVLLVRFRKYAYVLTGDIEKMYRQILVRPQDRKYQRILWRNQDGGIQSYEMNTVTFGLSPASYLAIRSLHQLAEDEGHRFPRAARALKEDFYVDDALTGANTREEAIALRMELSELLKTGGFTMRQWASNDSKLLEEIPAESVNLHFSRGETDALKTLGVYWKSSTDSIVYTVQTSNSPTKITKRVILAETARIFDPLGLLAPVIITAKILLQQLWSLKIDWDESLPSDIHTKWMDYYDQLQALNNLSFNRAAVLADAKEIQVHGFCDASEKAYGACLYLRTSGANGKGKSELLCAKSRVAPLKTTTVPRLELCGAVLLASLVARVIDEIHLRIDQVFYWTDSTIVLHWINTSPHQLKTFVANRVSEIQSKTNAKDWHHVRTHDNPADFASRGQMPREFIQPSKWHNGPTWLSLEEKDWPSSEPSHLKELPELRPATCLVMSPPIELDALTRYSSITKLQRVIAYCLRFGSKKTNKKHLSVLELRTALIAIIRATQRHVFSGEMKNIRDGKPLKDNGKLTRLNPFIDEAGILRVGGRLQNSSLPFTARHPIILPKNHHVTALIIEHEHRLHFHSGAQATLYAIRWYYWPLDGRSQVWKVIRRCVRCAKARPPSVRCIMGNLPKARITETRPFTHVGIDYCGPFFLKEKKHRNRNKIKAYIAVFVCLAVKAVHFEVVSDLTSEGFIAALRRFIGRRGMCTDVYSDNGTNFVGANNELHEISSFLKATDQRSKIHDYLAHKGIEWHFMPPQSPNFGGLWEAAVKSFKAHLKRVAGADLLFTFEEFNTLAIEIEAILNSRPLTPISSDPSDLLALTPGHFLVGDSLTSLRERDFRKTATNRLSNWQHIQKVKQDFWSRWRHDYLNELTVRNKWAQGRHDVKEGTIVLLKEDNQPPLKWDMGKVIECHPGTDGIIRTVTVKTANQTLKRNVRRLAPLPVQTDDEQVSSPPEV